MKFELNGQTFEVDGPLSVRTLLERFELGAKRLAVAINGEVVPRSRFDAVTIRGGDRVEVIQAVGGG